MLHAAALALAAQHSYGEAAAKAANFFSGRDFGGEGKWQHMIVWRMLFVGNGQYVTFVFGSCFYKILPS